MGKDVRDVMAIMESKRWDIEKIITYELPWEKIFNDIEITGDVHKSLNVVIKY